MDDATSDLIVQLCTRIGMIMEDASETALTIGGLRGQDRRDALIDLQTASDEISALIAAAAALNE